MADKEHFTSKITPLCKKEKPDAQGIAFVIGMTVAGTNIDVDNMYSTFQKDLNFAVLRENNLSRESLKCLIQAGAEYRYPLNYDYVAFYFAGHGGIDDSGALVVTSDNAHVNIQSEIIRPFEDGNKGEKKHKFFFFFDCCLSGKVRRTNVEVTDGLAAFATSVGERSGGDRIQGGLWTRYLSDNLKLDLPLINILSRTHDAINKKDRQSSFYNSNNIGEINLKQGAKGGFSIMKKSPDDYDVFDLLRDHSADWNDLGIELGVKENQRTALSRTVALSDNGKLNKILSQWIQAQPTPVTWEKVFEVLIKLDFRPTAQNVQDFLERVDIVDRYKLKPNYKPFK